jgi:membrane protein implicated in regulation of membrane protease activity
VSFSLIWAVVAASLVIGEMFTGEFTLLSLGLGAAAAAIVAATGLGFVPQCAAALVFSVVSLFLMAPWLRRRMTPRHTPDPIEAMIGVECEVIEAIAPPALGKVKLDGVVWGATSDTALPVGARVMITEVDGSRLRVMDCHDLLPLQPRVALEEEAERLRRLAQDESQRQS